MKIDKKLKLDKKNNCLKEEVIECKQLEEGSEIKDIKRKIKGKISNKKCPFKGEGIEKRLSLIQEYYEEKRLLSPEEAKEILSLFHLKYEDLEKGYIGFPMDEYPTVYSAFKEGYFVFKKLCKKRRLIRKRIKEFKKMKVRR